MVSLVFTYSATVKSTGNKIADTVLIQTIKFNGGPCLRCLPQRSAAAPRSRARRVCAQRRPRRPPPRQAGLPPLPAADIRSPPPPCVERASGASSVVRLVLH